MADLRGFFPRLRRGHNDRVDPRADDAREQELPRFLLERMMVVLRFVATRVLVKTYGLALAIFMAEMERKG